MKEKITKLETQLVEEKRRNEDLQFNVDEATFCGEELNVSKQKLGSQWTAVIFTRKTFNRIYIHTYIQSSKNHDLTGATDKTSPKLRGCFFRLSYHCYHRWALKSLVFFCTLNYRCVQRNNLSNCTQQKKWHCSQAFKAT